MTSSMYNDNINQHGSDTRCS